MLERLALCFTRRSLFLSLILSPRIVAKLGSAFLASFPVSDTPKAV
jgi:hypothetical protein